MMELRLAEHLVTPGKTVVEIWDGDTLRGAIYPTDEGVKIVSKYFAEFPLHEGLVTSGPPKMLFVRLKKP